MRPRVRLLAVPLLVVVGVSAFAGQAREASTDCTYGPQTGRVTVETETPVVRLDLFFLPPASAQWIQAFGGSVSFILSGPAGTQTLLATTAPVGPSRGSIFSATGPGLSPGTYQVHAQWQVGCADGTSEPLTSPTVSFTVKEGTTPPRPDFSCCGPGSAAAGAACDSENPVDEPYGVTVFLTTNGSLPTLRSRHYGTFMPHGCARPVPLRTIVRYPASCVAVTLEEDGSIGIRVARHGALDPTRHRCTSSAPRLLRTLFVVKSGQTVIGAMRVRFFHQPQGTRDFISAAFDSGPCPVRCSRGH